jgi:hypothetical protein
MVSCSTLERMPSVLGIMVDQLAEQTGWTYFIVAAGRNPCAGGQIFMRKCVLFLCLQVTLIPHIFFAVDFSMVNK